MSSQFLKKTLCKSTISKMFCASTELETAIGFGFGFVIAFWHVGHDLLSCAMMFICFIC